MDELDKNLEAIKDPELGAVLATLVSRQTEHHREIGERLAGLESSLAHAFPAGDLEGHRRYHQSIIEWRELRNRMIRQALIEGSKAGGVAAVGWLLYAVWTAFKMEITK